MGVKINLWFIIYEGRDTVIKNVKKKLKLKWYTYKVSFGYLWLDQRSKGKYGKYLHRSENLSSRSKILLLVPVKTNNCRG